MTIVLFSGAPPSVTVYALTDGLVEADSEAASGSPSAMDGPLETDLLTALGYPGLSDAGGGTLGDQETAIVTTGLNDNTVGDDSQSASAFLVFSESSGTGDNPQIVSLYNLNDLSGVSEQFSIAGIVCTLPDGSNTGENLLLAVAPLMLPDVLGGADQNTVPALYLLPDGVVVEEMLSVVGATVALSDGAELIDVSQLGPFTGLFGDLLSAVETLSERTPATYVPLIIFGKIASGDLFGKIVTQDRFNKQAGEG